MLSTGTILTRSVWPFSSIHRTLSSSGPTELLVIRFYSGMFTRSKFSRPRPGPKIQNSSLRTWPRTEDKVVIPGVLLCFSECSAQYCSKWPTSRPMARTQPRGQIMIITPSGASYVRVYEQTHSRQCCNLFISWLNAACDCSA